MVSTLNLQADACHVIHLVRKVLFLSYYAESKRISLITIFFVTTFFVVVANDSIICLNRQVFANNYIPLTAQSPRSRLR